MNRIRVVHIISDTNIGGAGVLLCNLLRHTDRTRYAPYVILPWGSALIPRLDTLDVPHLCYGKAALSAFAGRADKSADMRAIPEITGMLRRLRPQILHTHASLAGRVAGLLAGVPSA